MRNRKLYIAVLITAAMISVTACKDKPASEPAQAVETEVKQSVTGETVTGAALPETEEETSDDVSKEEEMKDFADMIKEAVAAKDMEALEKMLSYPTYIGSDASESIIINSTDEFLALKPEDVFTEALINAIAAVDTSTLEMTEAGAIMGEGTPNITFNILEGNCFGITGINK